MDDLTQVVKKLIVQDGVKHNQILTHIRSVLVDLGKQLPKVQVLYNCCYGGFGFSDEFVEFVKQHNAQADEYDFDARTEYVQFIRPFGEFILSKYPMFRRMVMLSRYHGIDDMVSCARKVFIHKNIVDNYEKRRALLQSYLNNPYLHGNKNRVNDQSLFDVLVCDYPDLSDYTRETYEYFIAKVNERIENSQADLKCVKDKYVSLNCDKLYEQLEPIVYQMSMEKDDVGNREQKNSKGIADLLKAHGEQDAGIWYNFRDDRLNEYTMRFMRIMHQDYEEPMLKEDGDRDVYDFLVSQSIIQVPDDMYDKIVLNVGLVCASDRYCSLDIHEIPPYVEWDVSEYDGRERIHIF